MAEEPGQETRNAPNNEDKLRRGLLIGITIAGAILGAILLVVFLWVWVHPTDPTEKKDFIQAVGVLLAALAALGGLYFTRASTKDQLELARENTEKQLRQARESTRDQLKQARESQERTQRVAEQGQITDRFTRAIDQLGATDDDRNPRLEIRLGGIYALERIARDSPERDYNTVMEVLTAYVRENSSRERKEVSTQTTGPNEDTQRKKEGVEQDAEPTLQRLPADIQAILDVISRRREDRVQEPNRVYINLSNATLRGANLREADLRGANLQEANLQRVRGMTQEQINMTVGSSKTMLPKFLNPPDFWSMSIVDQLMDIRRYDLVRNVK